jgi:hypothetical protein
MKVSTLLTAFVIGMIVLGAELYDAVTGDVTAWWEDAQIAAHSRHTECDCCKYRVDFD